MPIPKLVVGDSSPFSDRAVTNPFAGDPSMVYNRHGTYRGKLSTSPYDPDSIGTQFGRYGRLALFAGLDHNPFGAGNPFRYDSPTNPYEQR